MSGSHFGYRTKLFTHTLTVLRVTSVAQTCLLQFQWASFSCTWRGSCYWSWSRLRFLLLAHRRTAWAPKSPITDYTVHRIASLRSSWWTGKMYIKNQKEQSENCSINWWIHFCSCFVREKVNWADLICWRYFEKPFDWQLVEPKALSVWIPVTKSSLKVFLRFSIPLYIKVLFRFRREQNS